METKIINPIECWIQNHTENPSQKLKSQTDPTCVNFIAATHNVTQKCVLPPRDCMHSQQHLGMLLMSWRMVSWGDPLPNMDHGISVGWTNTQHPIGAHLDLGQENERGPVNGGRAGLPVLMHTGVWRKDVACCPPIGPEQGARVQ